MARQRQAARLDMSLLRSLDLLRGRFYKHATPTAFGIVPGAGGGEIVVQGPPEVIANCERSQTGKYLARVLGKG